MRNSKIDRPFLISVVILVVSGYFIFSSASLGLLARESASFGDIALKQLLVGVIGGGIVSFFVSRINYKVWRKYSFLIFLLSIILTLLVFLPGIGAEINGARRWVFVGPFSFQPSEILKIGFVIYLAAWLSGVGQKVRSARYGLIPFIILSSIVSVVMLLQPDTDTLAVMLAAGLAMFVVAGARWRDVFLLIIAAIIGLVLVATMRPYVMDRITSFLNPAENPLTSGYQIQQSLIAIGSGGISGRGFGQSVQKFNFLPEPIGDSIFAVAAEEFGFMGAVLLIALFIGFAMRGFRISTRSPDIFSRLVVVGIVILIITGSFINVGAMLGVLPVSGLPLSFVSHGGTALFMTLFTVGIVFNISRYQKSNL